MNANTTAGREALSVAEADLPPETDVISHLDGAVREYAEGNPHFRARARLSSGAVVEVRTTRERPVGSHGSGSFFSYVVVDGRVVGSHRPTHKVRSLVEWLQGRGPGGISAGIWTEEVESTLRGIGVLGADSGIA